MFWSVPSLPDRIDCWNATLPHSCSIIWYCTAAWHNSLKVLTQILGTSIFMYHIVTGTSGCDCSRFLIVFEMLVWASQVSICFGNSAMMPSSVGVVYWSGIPSSLLLAPVFSMCHMYMQSGSQIVVGTIFATSFACQSTQVGDIIAYELFHVLDVISVLLLYWNPPWHHSPKLVWCHKQCGIYVAWKFKVYGTLWVNEFPCWFL